MRSALRAAAVVMVAALGIAISTGLVAWRAVAPLAGQREQVLASVAAAVGWPIEAGAVEISWLPPAIVARELNVADDSPYGPGMLAYAEEARFELSIPQLLRGRIVVDEVRLQAPVVRAVRGADGGWNLRRRTPAGISAAHEVRVPSAAPGISVQTVRVRGGRLALRDRGVAGLGEYEVRDVNLRLRRRDGGFEVDFDGRALEGGERNLAGSLRVPAVGTTPAGFDLRADRVEGARLAELIALLRGRLPFGIALEGPVDLRLEARAPTGWPPAAVDLDVEVTGTDAALRTSAGWIGKAAGGTLDGKMRLRATRDSLALVSADVQVDGGRIEVREDEPGAGATQGPLAITSRAIEARAVAGWVPALAVVEPTGALTIDGRIEPGRPSAGRVTVAGQSLRVSAAGMPVDLGDGRIHLDLDEEGSGLSGTVGIARVSGDGASLGGVEGRIGGGRNRLRLDLAAREGDFRGAPLRRVALETTLDDDGLEIRAARADALGGAVLARGRIARIDDGRYRAVLDPSIESIDLAGLLAVVGSTGSGRGSLAGTARLVTTGSDLREAVRNLAGDFDVRLRDGEIGGLNVAATTLAGLRGVPGLRDAVLRGAGGDAPRLLSSASSIGELAASGRVGGSGMDVETLRLRSEDYTFDARGRIGFDGATDLSGRLELSRSASKALVSEAGLASLLSSGDGIVGIPIVVRGTWPQLSGVPTTDFVGRLARRAVGGREGDELGGWMKRFLGGRGAKVATDEAAGAPAR